MDKLNEENQEWFDSKISKALVVFAPFDVKQKLLEMQKEIEGLKANTNTV